MHVASAHTISEICRLIMRHCGYLNIEKSELPRRE
jgi:hypothetical protein